MQVRVDDLCVPGGGWSCFFPSWGDPFHGALAVARAAGSLRQPWRGARRVPRGAGAAGRQVVGAPRSSRATRAFSWALRLGERLIFLQSTSASDLNRDACRSPGSCELLLAPGPGRHRGGPVCQQRSAEAPGDARWGCWGCRGARGTRGVALAAGDCACHAQPGQPGCFWWGPGAFEQSPRPCLERSQEGGGQAPRVWREAARIIGDTGTLAELDLLSAAKRGRRKNVCPRCERARAER